uniref:Uncharacterized protein n=1 Tax=viral metagenome TaxID=1070528 RepID=A0A6C0BY89_9ZZZZ
MNAGDYTLKIVSQECPYKNHAYYQTLRPDCLGSCPEPAVNSKKIDRIRGIPHSGNMVSAGNLHTKHFTMSHGANHRRGSRKIAQTKIVMTANRQHSGHGRGNRLLCNFR